MSCTTEGKLRAYLDDALSIPERQAVAAHLDGCARCRERLDALRSRAALAGTCLSSLTPPTAPDPRRALQALASQADDESQNKIIHWRDMVMRNKSWRAVAIGLTALALVVGTFSFAPTRTLARQLLSVFRVHKFAVIQIDPSESQLEAIEQTFRDVLSDQEPQVVVDEPETTVDSLEEARALAGFDVRMPAYLPGEGPLRFSVKGRTEVSFPLKRESLTLLYEVAGLDPALVPADFEAGEVRAIAPVMVGITREPYTVVQVLEPTVEYPEGLDPQSIGQAGLSLLGFSEEDAERISQSIDWSNTLLLPVPANMASVQETDVAGAEAFLLRPVDGEEDAALLWQRDEVVYLVSARAGAERLVKVAASMF
ncbi:MAG: zf-HC2 domain-containing protein [Anaerolineae bacterium]|nr:zf-HC2 domain-containing protein [Anaerolineae bacterium]